MMIRKKAFLSHSHENKDIAERIASELISQGVDVWLDKWEINLGDSLIQKIFMEGLSNCDVFLILISKHTLLSKWVKEELDIALIRKIEGETKVISILLESCDLPTPLKPLLWIDLSNEFDKGIKIIIDSIYGISRKPHLCPIPDYVVQMQNKVHGLSSKASVIALYLAKKSIQLYEFEKSYSSIELYEPFKDSFTIEEFNEIVDELEDNDLVLIRSYFGTEPFSFGHVTPSYKLFLHLKDYINYDLENDVKIVSTALVARGKLSGNELRNVTGLSPISINRSVALLAESDLIDVHQFLNTSPYDFAYVFPTRKTRQFVEENCL